ncbi:unnamed protein product, partial [Ilex paraguariensis]
MRYPMCDAPKRSTQGATPSSTTPMFDDPGAQHCNKVRYISITLEVTTWPFYQGWTKVDSQKYEGNVGETHLPHCG